MAWIASASTVLIWAGIILSGGVLALLVLLMAVLKIASDADDEINDGG